MGKIRNVVFDLGGVMINYNPRKYIEDLGYKGEKCDRLCNAIFRDPVWVDMDKGIYMTYEEALDSFVKRHPDLEEDIRFFFKPGWMEVYTVKKDTEEILYNWVAERSDIYILSNYAADGFSYIWNKYPFFRKAKGGVCSAFEHCLKPEPEIYQILLNRYGLKADETVFIDDIPENVEGAEKVGIHGILFTTAQEVKDRLIELGL